MIAITMALIELKPCHNVTTVSNLSVSFILFLYFIPKSNFLGLIFFILYWNAMSLGSTFQGFLANFVCLCVFFPAQVLNVHFKRIRFLGFYIFHFRMEKVKTIHLQLELLPMTTVALTVPLPQLPISWPLVKVASKVASQGHKGHREMIGRLLKA